MKRFLLSIASIVPVLLIAQVKEEWVARFKGAYNTFSTPVLAVDNQRNVYITGAKYYSVDKKNISALMTIKYNSQGKEEWTAIYDSTVSGEGKAIAINSKGGIIVGGYYNGNYIVIEYGKDGSEHWSSEYDGPHGLFDDFSAMTLDDQDNIYVTGYVSDENVWFDYATLKYNHDGQQQWVALYDGGVGFSDWARDIAVDKAGNVYVAGYSHDVDTLCDFATIKYSPAGKELWVARYNGTGGSNDFAYVVAADDSGNVYVAGSARVNSGGQSESRYCIIKYDIDGVQIQETEYEHRSGLTSMILGDSGAIYVTGTYVDSVSYEDYLTVKYSSAGLHEWVGRYNGVINYADMPTAMAVDNSGNVYVTGVSQSLNVEDYATVKYGIWGDEQWVIRYDGSGPLSASRDMATAIAVDGNGNVYVTGWSHLDENYKVDYVTIKYSQETGVADPAKPGSLCNLEISGSKISYTLPQSSPISVKLYDASGRLVESLFSGTPGAGKYSLTWNRDNLPRGVYFIRLETNAGNLTKKALICR